VTKPIQQELRDRIAMARMLCVLGMIFVHVPDGQTDSPLYAFNAGGLGFFLEGLLVEGPGRAGAALLSFYHHSYGVLGWRYIPGLSPSVTSEADLSK